VMSELRTERAEEKSSKNWQGKSRKIKESNWKQLKATESDWKQLKTTESNWKQKVLALNWFPLVPLHHVTLVTECNTRNVLKYLKLCTLQNTDDHSDFMLKSGNLLLRKFGTSQSTSLAETLGEFWRVQLPWRVYTNYILHYITISYYESLILIDTDVLLMNTDVSFIWWFWYMLTTCWYWSVWSPCASAVSRWGPASKAGKPTPTRPTDLPWTCHGLLIAFTALVLQIYASFKIQKSPNSSKLCLSFPGVLFVCWVSCLIGGSPCSGVNRNSAGKSAEKEEVSTLRATRAHWPMAGFKPSGVRLLDDSTSEL
jgi:hypothetical protein